MFKKGDLVLYVGDEKHIIEEHGYIWAVVETHHANFHYHCRSIATGAMFYIPSIYLTKETRR